jgi:phenylpropionate dioxygenase-like ring-hydroxylating dioxygenase large terminal subunit
MLREYWYIACASSRLDSQPRAVRILDQDIVVYRDTEGRAHALLDRCCHRGVKLSAGKVTEDGLIACAYHGWRFDGTGRCVHVPSLLNETDVPKGFATPAFRCAEQDGYIWVWMGEGEPQPAAPDPIPEFADHGWHQGVADYACPGLMVMENQFDIAHPAFTHEGTHPAYFAMKYRVKKMQGLKDLTVEIRLTEKGLVSFYPATQNADDPIPEKFYSLVYFELPNRVLLRQVALGMDLSLVLHIVPTGEKTCRMEWMQRKRGVEGLVWIEEDQVINAQDRVVMESSQYWYDLVGDDFERSVEADYVTLLLRRIVAQAAAGTWQSAREGMTPRRLLTLRT